MNMKKILLVFVLLLSVFGCAAKPEPVVPAEPQALKVIAPTGAPALSLINYVEKFGQETITTTQGADALQAALINAEHEFDVIIAPVNLGVKLATAGKSDYKLLGVVTWGNLYLVRNDDLIDSDKEVAFFGESAVPGKVVGSLDFDFTQEIKWYSAVSDVSAALLAGDASYALLAEPVLTATLANGKKNNLNLSVVADLQQMFNEKYGTNGYPQAAVFVTAEALSEKKVDVEELVKLLSGLTSSDVAKINGNESFYGVPSAAVVEKAFDGMNVKFTKASECTNELAAFLKLFGISDFASVVAE